MQVSRPHGLVVDEGKYLKGHYKIIDVSVMNWMDLAENRHSSKKLEERVFETYSMLQKTIPRLSIGNLFIFVN